MRGSEARSLRFSYSRDPRAPRQRLRSLKGAPGRPGAPRRTVITEKLVRTALMLGVVIGASGSVPVLASTAQSWAQLKPRVVEACRHQSGLVSAKVTDYWPYFEAHVVAMVSGVYPRKHMTGRRAKMLCLYDKHTGRAEVQEPAEP